MSSFQDLGLTDLKALERAIQEQKKNLVAQEQARQATFVQEYVDDVILNNTDDEGALSQESTDKWVGWKSYGIPVTGADGRKYTVSVTVTDVDAKAAKIAAADAPAPTPEADTEAEATAPEPEPASA